MRGVQAGGGLCRIGRVYDAVVHVYISPSVNNIGQPVNKAGAYMSVNVRDIGLHVCRWQCIGLRLDYVCVFAYVSKKGEK